MQKNDLLRYIVASDVAGRFMMTANEVDAAARAGTKIKSQTDLNAFIENASEEQKHALGAELGIADSEWATLKLKRFNEAAAAYRESGKLEQRRAEAAANKAKVEEALEKNPDAFKSAPMSEAKKAVYDGIDRSEFAAKEKASVGEAEEKSRRYAIDVLEDGKTYVEASRKVINGTTKAEQRKEISNFFNQLLQGGESLDIHTIEGDVLTITKKDTAKKARDDFKSDGGKPVRMSDEEFAVKLRVESHIDEVAEVSRRADKPLFDEKKHSFAKDGFTYRRAYFKDFDGKYYEVKLSIGQNGTVATVYNVGKIKESVLPSAKVVAVVESKAPWKTLSSNSISQKSDLSTQNSKNSSEKSSKEKISELKERINVKKIDAYCRENIEEYASMSAANQSMIRQIVREGRVYGLDDADILSYARVAARSGLNIVYDENLDAKGNAGAYDPENNRIVVNPKAEKKQELILIHELDHAVRAYLGVDGKIHYLAYKGAEQRLSKETRDFVHGKEYSEQKIDVSREELFADEASAYYTEAILGPKVTIDMLLGKEPSLAKKILNFFTGAARAYSKDAKLSKEARRHYKNFKKMFDDFAEWNQGRNAETAVESVGDGKASRKTYASINAKTADKMQLSNAREMLKNGASLEEVRKATGWFRGYDGKWRFEINDADSHLIENSALEKHTDDGEVYFTGKLSDIFDHKALYESYPELKDINVVIQKTELGVDGIYQPNSNYITLSIEQFKRHTKAYHDYLDGGRKAEIKSIEASEAYKEYNRLYDDEVMDSMEPEKWLEAEKTAREKFYSSELGKRYYELMWGKNGFTGDKFEFGWAKPAKETLLHELQHAVQDIEGLASGTNTRDPDYDRNAGEIEARDTARRANMTAEERKNTQPDVYQEGVVVKRNKADAYLIVELQNGMQYVQASEGQVISGTDPEDWSKQVANYINKTIRNGTDFVIKTEQGDLLTITRDTAYKSATRNQVKNPDGTYRTMTDAEYRTKINASVHINELAQVSKKWNKPNVPDTKKHKFAKDGFSYRTAYFKDFDGKYYRLTISVGENGSVSTVYNVGQLKKDALPNGKIKTVYSGSKANSASHSSIIYDSAEKSTGSAKKVSENSSDSGKSIRKSKDITAKLEDAEDSDKVTISKGQAQKLAANYNSDRVYDKKDVVKALRGIDGFANLPEDMQKELLRDVWVGLNSRYGKGARETFVEVMSNKIPYMLLTEAYTEENAKEYGRLQSAKKRAKKTLEGKALKEKLEAIDRELEKLENVPDRLFDTYEQSRIDEINREIAEALNKLLDGGKPSLRSKIEGEFDASDAGKWKKKYIEAEFNETSAEKWKTKYYEARGRAKKLLNLSYQVQKMRDLKLGTFLNATDYKNEIFRETFDILGSINFRGNISPKTVRRAMARLAEWYAPDNPVLAEIDGQPGTRLFSDYIAIEINNIASGEGELSMHELDMLDNILRHATNIVENFNRVWKDGAGDYEN